MFLCEWFRHVFGFPDCHPPCFGVVVCDSWDYGLVFCWLVFRGVVVV